MYVPYPAIDGLGNAAEHGMIWCLEVDTAEKIATYETVITTLDHKVVVVPPEKTPDNLKQVCPGVFVKQGKGESKARQRVGFALEIPT